MCAHMCSGEPYLCSWFSCVEAKGQRGPTVVPISVFPPPRFTYFFSICQNNTASPRSSPFFWTVLLLTRGRKAAALVAVVQHDVLIVCVDSVWPIPSDVCTFPAGVAHYVWSFWPQPPTKECRPETLQLVTDLVWQRGSGGHIFCDLLRVEKEVSAFTTEERSSKWCSVFLRRLIRRVPVNWSASDPWTNRHNSAESCREKVRNCRGPEVHTKKKTDGWSNMSCFVERFCNCCILQNVDKSALIISGGVGFLIFCP